MEEKIKERIKKMCFECSSLNTEIIGRTLKCRGCDEEFCIDNGEGGR